MIVGRDRHHLRLRARRGGLLRDSRRLNILRPPQPLSRGRFISASASCRRVTVSIHPAARRAWTDVKTSASILHSAVFASFEGGWPMAPCIHLSAFIILVQRAAVAEDVLFFLRIVPGTAHDHVVTLLTARIGSRPMLLRRLGVVVRECSHRLASRRADGELITSTIGCILMGYITSRHASAEPVIPPLFRPLAPACASGSSYRSSGRLADTSTPPLPVVPASIFPGLEAFRNPRQRLSPRWRRVSSTLGGQPVGPSRRPGPAPHTEDDGHEATCFGQRVSPCRNRVSVHGCLWSWTPLQGKRSINVALQGHAQAMLAAPYTAHMYPAVAVADVNMGPFPGRRRPHHPLPRHPREAMGNGRNCTHNVSSPLEPGLEILNHHRRRHRVCAYCLLRRPIGHIVANCIVSSRARRE